VNKSSCPWHRKDPQEHGHVLPETRLLDLRARVADLGLYAQFVAAVVPAIEAVRHLDAVLVALRTRDQPSPAAQTDENCAASVIFALSRKVAVSSRLRVPCFCLLIAHCSSAHSTYPICSLSGWGLLVRGTRLRPLLWVSWRKRRGETRRKREGWVWGLGMGQDASSVRDPHQRVLSL
jgi:hypothetical protein